MGLTPSTPRAGCLRRAEGLYIGVRTSQYGAIFGDVVSCAGIPRAG